MASSATPEVERDDDPREQMLVTNAEIEVLRALHEEVIRLRRSVRHRPDPSWS